MSGISADFVNSAGLDLYFEDSSSETSSDDNFHEKIFTQNKGRTFTKRAVVEPVRSEVEKRTQTLIQ